jgi:hypothetical protein
MVMLRIDIDLVEDASHCIGIGKMTGSGLLTSVAFPIKVRELSLAYPKYNVRVNITQFNGRPITEEEKEIMPFERYLPLELFLGRNPDHVFLSKYNLEARFTKVVKAIVEFEAREIQRKLR